MPPRAESESNTRKTASARRPPRGREGRSVLGAAPKHWCAGALPRTPPTVLRKGRVPRIHYFSTLPYLYTPVTYFIAARARLSTGNFNVATRSVGVWTAVKKRTQVTKERFAANAGCALGRSAPRAKGSTGARSRRAATPGCQATLVALRSLWGGLAVVPRSSLGGRRPWWRSAAPGDAIFVRRLFRALPPLGFGLDLLPEVRLGPIFERFLETKVSIRLEIFLIISW